MEPSLCPPDLGSGVQLWQDGGLRAFSHADRLSSWIGNAHLFFPRLLAKQCRHVVRVSEAAPPLPSGPVPPISGILCREE